MSSDGSSGIDGERQLLGIVADGAYRLVNGHPRRQSADLIGLRRTAIVIDLVFPLMYLVPGFLQLDRICLAYPVNTGKVGMELPLYGLGVVAVLVLDVIDHGCEVVAVHQGQYSVRE